ncbi:hypothetical protein [Vulcanisaeta thermophila]|uniref:hypothetical protein n=1 Tax=Vulcanisaeta thermophila TaxID=867917 RepID=UPI00350E35D5
MIRWIINTLNDIRDALGGGFEYYTARVIKLLLKERGIDCDVRANVTLPIDGFKEIDIFCPEPLIIGEVTVRLRSREEADNEIEKLRASVDAAERFTGRKTHLKVIAVEFVPSDVAQYLMSRAKDEGIYLIIGREYETQGLTA